MGKSKSEPVDPVEVGFCKFDGGKMVTSSGTLLELSADFVRVKHTADDGSDVTVKFRRCPGRQAGWGVGVAKFWRLNQPDREKYVHPDTPVRRRP